MKVIIMKVIIINIVIESFYYKLSSYAYDIVSFWT